jgi:hypothetical protein
VRVDGAALRKRAEGALADPVTEGVVGCEVGGVKRGNGTRRGAGSITGIDGSRFDGTALGSDPGAARRITGGCEARSDGAGEERGFAGCVTEGVLVRGARVELGCERDGVAGR